MLMNLGTSYHSKGPHGIIGSTLQPNTVKTWALGIHSIGMLIKDVDSVLDVTINPSGHKEELKGRINSDAKDRSNIKNKLEESIHLLDTGSHPPGRIVHERP